MAATASYSAVPSILMVAPTGRTKRAICRSTWQFSNKHFMVMGSVAELRREETTVYHNIKIQTDCRTSKLSTKRSWTLTWRRSPGRSPWPAAAHGCRRRGSSLWGWNRREAEGWAHGQRGQRVRWYHTSPASSPVCSGPACPGSSLPPGRWFQMESTWYGRTESILMIPCKVRVWASDVSWQPMSCTLLQF